MKSSENCCLVKCEAVYFHRWVPKSIKILEVPFALISISTLKMEAVCYSKTLAPVNIYLRQNVETQRRTCSESYNLLLAHYCQVIVNWGSSKAAPFLCPGSIRSTVFMETFMPSFMMVTSHFSSSNFSAIPSCNMALLQKRVQLFTRAPKTLFSMQIESLEQLHFNWKTRITDRQTYIRLVFVKLWIKSGLSWLHPVCVH